METHAKEIRTRTPTAGTFKPGSYEEFLWTHPEEVDRILREHGIDPDKLERFLAQGGGVIRFNNEKVEFIKEKA